MVLLYEALGTKDKALVTGLLGQLAGVAKGDERELNFMLSMVQGLEPKDPLEVMLATQMAVQLGDCRPQPVANSNTYRGQSTQSEPLTSWLGFPPKWRRSRYRTGGEQKVTVQHAPERQRSGDRGNVSTGVGPQEKVGQPHE
jgi:hypothetical protein